MDFNLVRADPFTWKEQVMRVLRVETLGDPSALELVEVATLVVDERTAVVRIVAASINPSDIKNIAGAMQRKALPRIPGRDYSCVVEKVRAAARRPTENPAISLVTPADPWS